LIPGGWAGIAKEPQATWAARLYMKDYWVNQYTQNKFIVKYKKYILDYIYTFEIRRIAADLDARRAIRGVLGWRIRGMFFTACPVSG
jgi:hypothetical protein